MYARFNCVYVAPDPDRCLFTSLDPDLDLVCLHRLPGVAKQAASRARAPDVEESHVGQTTATAHTHPLCSTL